MLQDKDLKNAIAYYRVSSLQQAEEHSAFEAYRYRLKQLGFEDSQIYCDIGSGANNFRPGYLLVLQKLKEGAKKVYVPELSRFSRSVEGWEQAIKDFQIAGAKLITLEGVELSLDTPEQIMLSRQLMTFAAYERERIQYRVLKGKEYARTQGKLMRNCFPYKPCPQTGKPIPNEDKYKKYGGLTVWQVAQEVIRIFYSLNGNMVQTIDEIYRRWGGRSGDIPQHCEPPRDNVGLREWLKNPIIRGHVAYFQKWKKSKEEKKPNHFNPITIYQNHPALISEIDYQKIQTLLSAPKPRRSKELVNPLSKHLFCGNCGSKMMVRNCTGSPRGKTHRYVRCSQSFKNALCRTVTCDRSSAFGLEIQDVEAVVIEALIKKAKEISEMVRPYEETDLRDPEYIELQNEVLMLEDVFSKFKSPDIGRSLTDRRSKLEALRKKLTESSTAVELMRDIADLAKEEEFWLSASSKRRQLYYLDFVDRVTIDKEKVEVILSI